MARSFSNTKIVSALVDGVSLAINRRGYSTGSQGIATTVVRGGSRSTGMVKQGEEGVVNKTETSWVPDPVTGYYRPENRAGDIDVADLREMLLTNKID